MVVVVVAAVVAVVAVVVAVVVAALVAALLPAKGWLSVCRVWLLCAVLFSLWSMYFALIHFVV